jgi:Anaerobic dehydrogenases, typically selenocysteine-containing
MSDQNKDRKDVKRDELWRSVDEYNAGGVTDETQYHEFAPGVKEEFDVDKELSGISRRKFLALMSASAAFMAAGCSDYRDKGELMPYNRKPDDITIGEANFYASTYMGCGHACGVLIKTREGRPIKVDGNPDHPVNAGKVCAKGQASVMDLYDPQRFSEPQTVNQGEYTPAKWQDVDGKVIAQLTLGGEGSAVFISHKVHSPTAIKLMGELQEKYKSVRFIYYDLFAAENRTNAWKKCYGEDSVPAVIKWDEADVILALEASLFGTDGNSIEQHRMIRDRRDVNNTKKFNRLYSAEANFTTTGANADYRIRIKPEHYYDFVLTLMNEVSKRGKGKGVIPESLSGKLSAFTVDAFSKKAQLSEKGRKSLNALIGDLVSNGSKSIVYAGEAVPEDVQVLVHLLNEVTGGSALYSDTVANVELHKYSTSKEIAGLVADMKAGKVSLLVNMDANPVYHFPKELGFEEALKKVKLVVSMALLPNETSYSSNFVLPLNHDFESWGDAKIRSNFTSTMQPVIAPLYNTRQKEAILLQWLSGKTDVIKIPTTWIILKLRGKRLQGNISQILGSSLHDVFDDH